MGLKALLDATFMNYRHKELSQDDIAMKFLWAKSIVRSNELPTFAPASAAKQVLWVLKGGFCTTVFKKISLRKLVAIRVEVLPLHPRKTGQFFTEEKQEEDADFREDFFEKSNAEKGKAVALQPETKTVVLQVSAASSTKIFERKICSLKIKTLTFAPPEQKTGISSKVSPSLFTQFFERKTWKQNDRFCIFAGPIRRKETD